jgi:hypothetical protein
MGAVLQESLFEETPHEIIGAEGRHNNSLNPTHLSVPFINVVALWLGYVLSSADGLILAL